MDLSPRGEGFDVVFSILVKNHILYSIIMEFGIVLKMFLMLFICEYMPRNTRKAMPAKSKNAWPNVLRFIASLLFLYVIFSGMTWLSPWVTGNGGQLAADTVRSSRP